jgi:hypothetical protein
MAPSREGIPMETGTRPKLIESGDFYSSLYLNDLSVSRLGTQHLGLAARGGILIYSEEMEEQFLDLASAEIAQMRKGSHVRAEPRHRIVRRPGEVSRPYPLRKRG